MRQKAMAWATGLIATLLIFTASALGDATKPPSQRIILETPNVVVGTVTFEGKPETTIIMIKGMDAVRLKKSCGCNYATYPELNLVILLNDDMEL